MANQVRKRLLQEKQCFSIDIAKVCRLFFNGHGVYIIINEKLKGLTEHLSKLKSSKDAN